MGNVSGRWDETAGQHTHKRMSIQNSCDEQIDCHYHDLAKFSDFIAKSESENIFLFFDRSFARFWWRKIGIDKADVRSVCKAIKMNLGRCHQI